jgi:hypothetical protein
MTTDEFQAFLNEQIKLLTDKIGDDKHSINDDVSLGKLTFYLAIRQALEQHASPQDMGLVGAFNDTLQQLGVLDESKTFFSLLGSA